MAHTGVDSRTPIVGGLALMFGLVTFAFTEQTTTSLWTNPWWLYAMAIAIALVGLGLYEYFAPRNGWWMPPTPSVESRPWWRLATLIVLLGLLAPPIFILLEQTNNLRSVLIPWSLCAVLLGLMVFGFFRRNADVPRDNRGVAFGHSETPEEMVPRLLRERDEATAACRSAERERDDLLNKARDSKWEAVRPLAQDYGTLRDLAVQLAEAANQIEALPRSKATADTAVSAWLKDSAGAEAIFAPIRPDVVRVATDFRLRYGLTNPALGDDLVAGPVFGAQQVRRIIEGLVVVMDEIATRLLREVEAQL